MEGMHMFYIYDLVRGATLYENDLEIGNRSAATNERAGSG